MPSEAIRVTRLVAGESDTTSSRFATKKAAMSSASLMVAFRASGLRSPLTTYHAITGTTSTRTIRNTMRCLLSAELCIQQHTGDPIYAWVLFTDRRLLFIDAGAHTCGLGASGAAPATERRWVLVVWRGMSFAEDGGH